MTADTLTSSFGRFDVLIVGGGAVGCAMACEAASRGLRAALLERTDFGAATSANSLRIVHGGLRYIQDLDFRRARASSAERATMLRIAPHIVSPLECVVPTLRSMKRGRAAFAIGLTANKVLMTGHNRGLPSGSRLSAGGLISREAMEQRAPGLAMQGVTGGARWFDGSMASDERLALAFALTARRHGAALLNHVEVLEGTGSRDRIGGVIAADRVTGKTLELAARAVLDCRGVGVLEPLPLLGAPRLELDFVKAANVVLRDRSLACAVGAPYRDVHGQALPGGRFMFARPADDAIIVGTWYFPRGNGRPELGRSEVEQILQDVDAAFPGWKVCSGDLLRAQVGFLPRDRTAAGEPAPIDRPVIIEAAALGGLRGVWLVQTEKWTTVRALSEQVISRLADEEHLAAAAPRTSSQPLEGGGAVSLTPEQSRVLSTLTIEQASRILDRHGSRAGLILQGMLEDPSLTAPLPKWPAVTLAEAVYALDHEQVRTEEDLQRRLSAGCVRSAAAESVACLSELMAKRGHPSGQARRT